MLATMSGWLIGWLLLSLVEFNNPSVPYSLSSEVIYSVLISLSVGISLWILTVDKAQKTLWFSMFGVGLLAGFVFIYEPSWPSSGLLNGISSSTLNDDNLLFPSIERFLFFVSLLVGVFFAAWRTKRFMLVKAKLDQWLLHLLAGTLMGIGAAIAQGGNDSQLLLALPSLSPAGFLAIGGIILGIFIGLYLSNT